MLLLAFVSTVVLSAVFGTQAKARFIRQLRAAHPDVFEQLGSPGIWVVKSMAQGVAIQRLVFAGQPVLAGPAESARTELRRVTILVVVALLANCIVIAWAFLNEAGLFLGH